MPGWFEINKRAPKTVFRKTVLENLLEKEKAEQEKQKVLEYGRKLTQKAEELEKKRLEEERLDNEMRRIATERAMKNYACG